uniref:MACPF domain-containing protein n=1 Tax=Macrostomum lignano TaxID=282301 RepID=A0A1I8J970_9PLAT
RQWLIAITQVAFVQRMQGAQLLVFALALSACPMANAEGLGTKVAKKAWDIVQNKLNPKSKAEMYQKAVDIVSDHITKSANKAEKLASSYMSAVDKDPGALITRESMKKIISGSSFLPQKAGTRTVSLQSDQGFNGFTNYQPSGWKITETMSGPTDKKEEPSETKEPVYTYPMGLGPVLLNQCTEKNYDKTSPCYNSKLFDLQITICLNQIDAANYIGVGFNGRGYYNAQSRRASLVQRSCSNRATFMGSDIPDTMNIFGIFETFAETKSFQSADEYMQYIRHKAGLSNQKNLFASEASKYGKASGIGFDLGGVGAAAGALIGAKAGGPAGAEMGAGLGGAIGGTINGGSGSGSGNAKQSERSNSSSATSHFEASDKFQKASNNFFAIMYVNVILYEISLDEVKPTDLSLALLKDYMSLPVSYFSIGADVKYQNFLLRWGTHFIRSGKFGGQLKITKRARSDKVQSAQQFASIAETEFQSMFATLQSKYSQKESGIAIFFINTKSKEVAQNSQAKAGSEYSSSMRQTQSQSRQFQQSEFTQTTVEAQGGTPEIAEALVDFYTPAFKQIYHDWLASIKDYAKPFEFQLKAIDVLFNMNMNDLFPAGNIDFGCVKDGGGKANILIEPKTKLRYYIDVQTQFSNSTKIEVKKKVYCKYSKLDDFKTDLDRRRISLERAIGVYMAEGPFPTSTFELKGGEPGCEEATLGALRAANKGKSAVLKFSEMKKYPFLVTFDLPEAIPGLIPKQSKFRLIYRSGMWFATEPTQTTMHLYDGCEIPESKEAKICFRNIIMTYNEASGFLRVDAKDFRATKARIPALPIWLANSVVARVQKLEISATAKNDMYGGRGAVPCNIKWVNSHRLDPQKEENCIHFTAATSGDIFVILSAIPRDHSTWYYLQINPEGVSFYQAMELKRRDTQKGMGILGDSNLFQSFFVCVVQKKDRVTMQYGKADPVSEVGTVYSGYTFAPDSQFSRLSFYTFGSGRKPVSLMDIRLTRMLPQVKCLSKNYINVDGHCVLACHSECDQCDVARDNKSCRRCKHVRVETGSGKLKVTECFAECPPGTTLKSSKTATKKTKAKPTGLCEKCPAGTFKSGDGNQKCSPCPKGKISDAGAKSCVACEAGTFNDKLGQSKCQRCALGTYSSDGAEGAVKDTPCSAGYTAASDRRSCHKCRPEFGECYYPGKDFVSTKVNRAYAGPCQSWSVKSCSKYTEGECYRLGSTDYVSGISVTESGKTCQSWEIRTCPSGTSGKTCHEPSSAVKRAKKIGNTCRIVPGDSAKKPWCYTTTSKKWEYCKIPQC